MNTLPAPGHADTRLAGRAFGPFDLRVAAGERVAVPGPRGAGKPALLRLMACACAANAGTPLFDGRPLVRCTAQALARRRPALPAAAAQAT